jgi:hypothetical protein
MTAPPIVIAQQYSSTIFVSMCFRSRETKKKSGASLKIISDFFTVFFNYASLRVSTSIEADSKVKSGRDRVLLQLW